MSIAIEDMSDYARSVVNALGMEAHPESGWYVRDWQSPNTDADSARPLSSLIYFLLPEGDASAWHKVDADEIWLWHGPAPVTLQLGGNGPAPASDDPLDTITLKSGMPPRLPLMQCAAMRWFPPAYGSARCPVPAMRWCLAW
ncbi:cupin domain protein, PF06172 family [Bifidobacterium merycicum]|uniref:Cupin domain protein, PF06172 family n=1 Tax=Bifidobacterium merycicum TaxID=78345 RepID=A0A087BIW6_9BIFI|nr:cupin domain protein, PF06172 family [Bifidobacterium merycicum]SHE61222.1 hypothetical protein SAMN02745589_1224 [Bifidobacterium merycicum DSM 6492]